MVIIGSVGGIIVWLGRLKLPESPRWLAQQGRLEQADQVMRVIEAGVAADSGRALPAPEPLVVEDPRKGTPAEDFNPTLPQSYNNALGCQFLSDDRFYGFANWVPTLLIAKGIHV